jgi:hypothetical protein
MQCGDGPARYLVTVDQCSRLKVRTHVRGSRSATEISPEAFTSRLHGPVWFDKDGSEFNGEDEERGSARCAATRQEGHVAIRSWAALR